MPMLSATAVVCSIAQCGPVVPSALRMGLAAMGEYLRHVYVSGVRADDMRLRLKYAGVDEARIKVFYDYDPLIDAMCASEYPVFIMPTYTAMLDLRGRLQKQLGGKEFWE